MTADTVHATGIGPGADGYVTRRTGNLLGEADVVVGFSSVVDYVEGLTEADLLRCGYEDEGETLAEFSRRVEGGDRGVAVLMGDPNHSGYQFLRKVENAVSPDVDVRVVPGVSSVQVAASRARTPMEETTFVTLHKSGPIDDELARLADDAGERSIIVLPRPYDWMPEDVAGHLLDSGASEEADAYVMERLTHEDEEITETILGDLSTGDGDFSDLSVFVTRA